jgi:hypothetical protein
VRQLVCDLGYCGGLYFRLPQYQRITDAYELFYSITAQWKFVPESLMRLLAKSG